MCGSGTPPHPFIEPKGAIPKKQGLHELVVLPLIIARKTGHRNGGCEGSIDPRRPIVVPRTCACPGPDAVRRRPRGDGDVDLGWGSVVVVPDAEDRRWALHQRWWAVRPVEAAIDVLPPGLAGDAVDGGG